MIRFVEKNLLENYKYTSNFEIGEDVSFTTDSGENWHIGKVTAVRFSKAKVFYDVVCDYRGDLVRELESQFVRAVKKEDVAVEMFGKDLSNYIVDNLDLLSDE